MDSIFSRRPMNKSSTNVYQKIYDVVAKIPKGKVATYKQIAIQAGFPGNARLVGYALNRLKDNKIPWQRVINSQGKISYSISRNGHDDLQKKLLVDEGIIFSANDKIDIKIFGHF